MDKKIPSPASVGEVAMINGLFIADIAWEPVVRRPVGQVKQESRKTRKGDTVTESDDTSVMTVGDTYVNFFEDIDA